MKQQQQQCLTNRQIFKPNPPTAEAIRKAQFVDKTYHWTNARIRSRD
jgi:hypothetical protein